MRRSLVALFITLAFLQLIPVWGAQFFPTADGPSHLYNSWVFRELLSGRAVDAIRAQYEISWKPVPNWTGHLSMAAAMSVLPPLAAEKLHVSLIVAVLLAGAWRLATAASREGAHYAFLAFPFVYQAFLFWGFYNYSLSIGLYLLTIASWWRRRHDWRWRSVALTGAWLLLCYFTHPMATAFAIGSIGLLWLCTLRRGTLLRSARHLIALLPAASLLLWFTLAQGTEADAGEKTARTLLEELVTMSSVLFERPAAGLLVMSAFGLLIVMTIIRERLFRREEDALLVLFATLLLIYFLAPARLVGGGEVNERLAVFLPLVLLPWFSIRLPRALTAGLLTLLSIGALAYPLITLPQVRQRSRDISSYLEGTEKIRRGSIVLPVVFDGRYWLSHAAGHAARELQAVDLRNFEPATGYFPIAYRRGVDGSNLHDLEMRPEALWQEAIARKADYVLAWQLPAQQMGKARPAGFQLVPSRLPNRLFARRGEESFASVILPFVGTRGNLAASDGTVWRIDQTITNISNVSVRVVLGDCGAVIPCETELGAGASTPLTSVTQNPPYTLLTVDRKAAGALRAATTLQRVDARAAGFAAKIPQVTPEMFRQRLSFPRMRLEPGDRVNLRLWASPFVQRAGYTVHIASGGREVGVRKFATEPDGFQNDPDLLSWFPQLENVSMDADIRIEVDAPFTIWALAVRTDAQTRPVVHFPLER